MERLFQNIENMSDLEIREAIFNIINNTTDRQKLIRIYEAFIDIELEFNPDAILVNE
jgi:hypothetical protein